MGDGDELAGIVAAAIADNPDAAERSAAATTRRWARSSARHARDQGQADGGEVNRLIREQLGV